MFSSLYPLVRRSLFRLDAERAHHLTLAALGAAGRAGLSGCVAGRAVNAPVTVMGLRFDNAVGLAAGLDKEGACIDGLAGLGFGFIEVGTVTPRPQAGNPRPRMFRIPEAQALINRMGFNNGGVDRFLANVQASRWKGVLGLNIGKNASTPIERAVEDYLYCLDRVYPFASYVAINISSPN
ncbi:MAG: dihydroorotate dehydrogenase (quinone), partial [Janthinobacterium lividum]